MKKFLKQVFHSNLGITVRNLVNFRPPQFLHAYEDQYLASDLFVWRTDDDYETIFKGSNILKKYYGLKSYLKIIFYNESGSLIKEMDIDFPDIGTLTLLINEELLGVKSTGTFCVFNYPKDKTQKKLSVTNKCYVGYGKGGSYSMFHGNMVALSLKQDTPSSEMANSLSPTVSSRSGTYEYIIQKKFDSKSVVTLVFSNPLSREVNFSVNGQRNIIKPKGCILFLVDNEKVDGIIKIKSDFIFPRPIVICEDENYIDCHHG
tara:strand:- start:1219 stop:2001 length:783 start_codon:yes stop_codon:yes gene_type:complete